MHETGLTELVGREEELELLLRRWSRAKTGEGQVVLLSGEAGIGKSRLTAALLERLARSRTRACGISARRSTPTARFIRSSARWSAPLDLPTTTPRRQSSTSSIPCLRKAHVGSGRGTLCGNVVAAERWTLSHARISPTATPTENAGSAHCANRGAIPSNPVLMIFEDAHWTDPTSLEAFGRAVDRITDPSRVADRYVPTGI